MNDQRLLEQMEETLSKYKELPSEVSVILLTMMDVLKKQNREITRLKEQLRELKKLPKTPKFKPPEKKQPNKHPQRPKRSQKKNPEEFNSKLREELPIHEERQRPSASECPKCQCILHSKGNQTLLIQELEIKPKNIRFHLEKKQCPKCSHFESASLPKEYKGSSFGPELRSHISLLHYNQRMTEPQIVSFLKELGIVISKAQVHSILMKNGKALATIAKKILDKGLKKSSYVNVDETGWKTKKVSKSLWVVCNDLFSYFSITEKRNSEEARRLLKPRENKALAIVSDDFSCYNKLEINLKQLCWIHEIRHYEKLEVFSSWKRFVVEKKLDEIWKYYKEILLYRKAPSLGEAARLKSEFDRIFKVKSGYEDLNKRLLLTFRKRERLLVCLDYPEIVPENNEAERSLRHPVKIRNISCGSRSKTGENSLTNHLTFFETCKKLGRNLKQDFIASLQDPSSFQLSF